MQASTTQLLARARVLRADRGDAQLPLQVTLALQVTHLVHSHELVHLLEDLFDDLGVAARQRVLDLGAALYLEKPIGSEELLAEIDAYMAQPSNG